MYSVAFRLKPPENLDSLPDCKSVYAGSIPTSASTIRKPRRLTSAGFFFARQKMPNVPKLKAALRLMPVS